MTNGNPDYERLLAEDGWLPRLAQALVGDPGAAEDVVQDAALAAWESGAVAGYRLSPKKLVGRIWNLRREGRRRGKRGARSLERRELDHVDLDPTGRLVERAETARHLLEEVLGLQEPHRSVLVLFYFEGASTGEIAAQLGCRTDAVRARLSRARSELKARLDRRSGGDRSAWVSALLPFAYRSSSVATPLAAAGPAATLSVLLMTKIKIAALLVAMAGLLFFVQRSPGVVPAPVAAGGARAPGGTGDEDLVNVVAVSRAAALGVGAAEREPALVAGPEAPPAAAVQRTHVYGTVTLPDFGDSQAPPPAMTVQAYIYDRNAAAVGVEDVAVGPGGRFEYHMDPTYSAIVVAGAEGMSRNFRFAEGLSNTEPPFREEWLDEGLGVIPLQRAGVLTLEVVDGSGRAVVGATAQLLTDFGDLDSISDSTLPFFNNRPVSGITDESGQLEIRTMPQGHWRMRVSHPEYLAVEVGSEAPLLLAEDADVEPSPVRVTMESGAQLQGVATGARQEDGPVAVFLCEHEEEPTPSEVGTGAWAPIQKDGSFEFQSLPPDGKFRLQVFSGHSWSWSAEQRSLPVIAEVGESVTIDCLPGATVQFDVRDPEGAPVQGLEVQADFQECASFHWGRFRREVGRDHWTGGRVTLVRLVPDVPDADLTVELSAPGFQGRTLEPLRLLGTEALTLPTVVLQSETPEPEVAPVGPTLTLLVLDADGAPLPGVRVQHRQRDTAPTPGDDKPGRYPRPRITDKDGVAVFPALGVGYHSFRVTGWPSPRDGFMANRLASAAWPFHQVEVGSPNMASLSQTLQLPRMSEVKLSFLDNGQVVAGCRAELVERVSEKRRKRFAAEGLFRSARQPRAPAERTEILFQNVPVGDYEVLAFAAGGATELRFPLTVTESMGPVALPLPGARITGTAVTVEGEPIPGALIRFESAGYGLERLLEHFEDDLEMKGVSRVGALATRSPRSTVTDASGQFTLRYFTPSKERRISAVTDDRWIAVSEVVSADGDETVDIGQMVLRPAGREDLTD